MKKKVKSVLLRAEFWFLWTPSSGTCISSPPAARPAFQAEDLLHHAMQQLPDEVQKQQLAGNLALRQDLK